MEKLRHANDRIAMCKPRNAVVRCAIISDNTEFDVVAIVDR